MKHGATSFGSPASKEMFLREAQGYVPRISRRGEAELSVISLLRDGGDTVREIEQEFQCHFPDCCPSASTALMFVKAIIERYTARASGQ